MQTVTTTRPLTVTRATGRDFTLPAGVQVEVTFAGWTTEANGAMYVLGGRNFQQAAYAAGIRVYDKPAPGLTPLVRVDRLHRAVTHSESLHRYCNKCQHTGRINRDRSGILPHPRPCTACEGTGHAKTYPANGS